MKGTDYINTVTQIKTKNYNQHISFMVNKSYFTEYISSDSSSSEEPCVKDELINILQDDETTVIKYLLDIMRVHDIITEEEYQAVLYKYN
ncbi:MAG: hypothetical protein HDR71_04265 [Lachnospiraceae bacterium]|nr:hypothetical protein [Lachnospiraceae bacterium]